MKSGKKHLKIILKLCHISSGSNIYCLRVAGSVGEEDPILPVSKKAQRKKKSYFPYTHFLREEPTLEVAEIF